MRGKDLSGLAAYEAFDVKGRGYYLVRNKHRPEMLIVVSDGMSVPPGWYTDKGGIIRRVS